MCSGYSCQHSVAVFIFIPRMRIKLLTNGCLLFILQLNVNTLSGSADLIAHFDAFACKRRANLLQQQQRE